MDDPLGHLDRDLLSRDRMVRPDTNFPMREPRDTFERFRGIYGGIVSRGHVNDFDNPRLFGKFDIFPTLPFVDQLFFSLHFQSIIF